MYKIQFLYRAEHCPSVTQLNTLMLTILRSTLNTIIYTLWAIWIFLKSFAEMGHIVTRVLQRVASSHLRTTTPCHPVLLNSHELLVASWNVMAHTQKPDFVFRRNGRIHLNRRGRQFSRLLAAEVCTSAVVMLDTTCFEVVWRVLATHSIRQFRLHFPSRASPCAITFQREPNIFTDFCPSTVMLVCLM